VGKVKEIKREVMREKLAVLWRNSGDQCKGVFDGLLPGFSGEKGRGRGKRGAAPLCSTLTGPLMQVVSLTSYAKTTLYSVCCSSPMGGTKEEDQWEGQREVSIMRSPLSYQISKLSLYNFSNEEITLDFPELISLNAHDCSRQGQLLLK
jgi:hypothetical protein